METSEAYRVLTKVTDQGYYAVGVRTCGLSFVLKTLTSKEESSLRYHVVGQTMAHYRLYRLAYATLMIEGVEAVNDRPNSVQELFDLYMKLPSDSVALLDSTFDTVQQYYWRACRFLQGYCYDYPSRLRWQTRKNLSVTGISSAPGILSITGVPYVLEAWALTNSNLDKEEEAARSLSNAMLIASATNPKGVKSMSSTLETERKTKQADREEMVKYGSFDERDRALGIISANKEQWTAPLVTAKDMVMELERQMHGEKDRHDLFIESYISNMQKERQEQEEAEMRRRHELHALSGLSAAPVSGSFALTNEEMNKILSGKLDPSMLVRRKAKELKDTTGKTPMMGKRVLGA